MISIKHQILLVLSAGLLQSCTHFKSQPSEKRLPSNVLENTSPACVIPLFTWTHRPLTAATIPDFFRHSTIGAIEANQQSWNDKDPGNALAGNGMYFEGDPFSSRSYGEYLVMAQLKPRTPWINLTSYGPLEAGLTEELATAIRQNDMSVLHTWISQSGFAHALTLRASMSQTLDDLPVDISSVQVIPRLHEMKAFEKHQIISSDNRFETLLVEFADHLPLLEKIWTDDSKMDFPSDELVSQAIAAEFNSVEGIRDTIYELGSRLNIDPIEIFLSDVSTSLENIQEISQALKNKKYLSHEDHPATAAELRLNVIRHWKRGKGFKSLSSAWLWIKTYQKTYSIFPSQTDGGDKIIPSVFKTTCPQ